MKPEKNNRTPIRVEDQRVLRKRLDRDSILGRTLAWQIGREAMDQEVAERENNHFWSEQKRASANEKKGKPNYILLNSRLGGVPRAVKWDIAPEDERLGIVEMATGGTVGESNTSLAAPFAATSGLPNDARNPYAAAEPKLGEVIPGNIGGLPPPGTGPTIYNNPMAQELQSMGRGPDTELVHMTPDEVNSLRGLARQFGGDLSTNPNTGLPEAGFLSGILPTLFGGLLSLIPGVGPLMAAGIVGAGTTAVTGDLGKGLMAGLGAYGGSSLGAALGAGGAGAGAASAATNAASAATTGAATGAGSAGAAGLGGLASAAADAPTILAQQAAQGAGSIGSGVASGARAALGTTLGSQAAPQLAQAGAQQVASSLAPQVMSNAAPFVADKAPGFMQRFGDAAAIKGLPRAATTGLAGYGLLSGFQQPPNNEPPKQENKYPYEGPYTQAPRNLIMPTTPASVSRDSSEHLFFDEVNPKPGVLPSDAAAAFNSTKNSRGNMSNKMFGLYNHMEDEAGQRRAAWHGRGFASGGMVSPGGKGPSMKSPASGPSYTQPPMSTLPASQPAAPAMGLGSLYSGMQGQPRFAAGGLVALKEGSFVVDARTVSELGNGSSAAGQEVLSRMGGTPIQGNGDGVSDSVQASIDGKHPARVARDEVYFSPEAVARLGGGDPKRGTQKLYALMDKAAKARRTAKRGEDTNLRKGLM